MPGLAAPPFKAETSAPSPADSHEEGSHVLSRLHALFAPSPSRATESPAPHPQHPPPRSPEPFANGGGEYKGDSLARSRTEPARGTLPVVEAPPEPDRQAIKVFIVTWNMGDALPKGDLKVLFGEVPKYTPPASPPAGIPELPIENAHPYHIVVVAGQECPTHSGVPLGLAGGIIKGVRGTGHRKQAKDGLDAADAERDASGDSAEGGSGDDDVSTPLNRSQASSPNPPHTPVLQRHAHQPGSKGWRTMLDDWFCGPAASTGVNTPGGPAFLFPADSPIASAPPGSASLQPPYLLRSTSAPANARDITSQSRLSPFPLDPVRSPLARSHSSTDASTSDSSTDALEATKSTSLPSKPRVERPDIIIPNEEPNRTGRGSGCYLHLVKERLMGMYLSIYVYKGCEHLVQGVDKDFVTTGLARGRLGNKGGIGISLKLADHRFLFVNSHLAAHTDRISTRLANIAKIKTDLRLDCFLPPDDPRAEAEDITDRFDSVFWCGDLNFRLELSRLHAEWLVERKDFAEALRWDQLRNVMRDPDANPFPGFQEYAIDFPPTFKYDVWKSIKATNRDRRRSMRRQSNAKSPIDGALAASQPLSHVAEAEHGEAENPADRPPKDQTSDERDDGIDVTTRRSTDSAGPMSAAGTDLEDDDDLMLGTVDPSSYGSRHKAFEVAIKSKTKHLLSLVKMDNILTPSSSKKRITKRTSQPALHNKQSREFDLSSRRTSASTLYSERVETEVEEQPRTSTSTYRSIEPLRRPSDASAWNASPPARSSGRKLSVLKRTKSGRSVKEEADDGHVPHVDESVDHREGVYDSSKKQRVPSWCDRVLWKAHIVPDPDPVSGSDVSVQESSHKAFPRLSNVFTNISGHLRVGTTRSATIEPAQVDRVRISSPIGPPAPPSDTDAAPAPQDPHETLVASPEGSPALFDNPSYEGLIPPPKPKKSPVAHRLVSLARSGSATRHPLIDAASVPPSPPARPKMTLDPASPAAADRAVSSSAIATNTDSATAANAHTPTATATSRPRANSDTVPSAPPNHRIMLKSSPSFPPHTSNGGAGCRKPTPMRPALAMSSAAASTPNTSTPTRRSRTSLPDESGHTDASLHSHSHSHSHSNTHIRGATTSSPQDDQNAFMAFIRGIPHLLHHRSGAGGPTQHVAAEPSRRRHQKGEVVCLHYGTIDDAGMRALEGRSDHRPAIFAAAVYV